MKYLFIILVICSAIVSGNSLSYIVDANAKIIPKISNSEFCKYIEKIHNGGDSCEKNVLVAYNIYCRNAHCFSEFDDLNNFMMNFMAYPGEYLYSFAFDLYIQSLGPDAGVPPDPSFLNAYELFDLATDLGSRDAALMLGALHLMNGAIPHDHEKARRNLVKALEKKWSQPHAIGQLQRRTRWSFLVGIPLFHRMRWEKGPGARKGNV